MGCASCHTPTIVTAPAGTAINGGTFRVPAALGNKMIHPFSDFLLHDVGTGDGIVQNGGPQTRNKLRTVPLWGLRARGRFMHDAASQSFADAIARHGGQAAGARANFNALSIADRNRVLLFLSSLSGNGSRACAKRARPAPSPRSAVHADGSPSGGRPPLRSRFSSLQRASRSPSVFS